MALHRYQRYPKSYSAVKFHKLNGNTVDNIFYRLVPVAQIPGKNALFHADIISFNDPGL
jgi:hypothetical protein